MNMIKILYIEDDSKQRKTFSGQLRAKGFKVTVAASGKTGLWLFNRSSFDAILCDLNMPLMNGLEVLEKIKR